MLACYMPHFKLQSVLVSPLTILISTFVMLTFFDFLSEFSFAAILTCFQKSRSKSVISSTVSTIENLC